MKTIEKIDEVIENLKNNKTEEILAEEQEILNKIALIDECFIVIDGDDNDFYNYDFTNIIKLLNDSKYKIDSLDKIIKDIKNVITVKNTLGDEYGVDLDESQLADLKRIVENLEVIKREFQKRLEEISSLKINHNETKISEFESLKNILEGKGRRRYYTRNMINAFMSEVDITKMDPDEALELLEGFFNTRNMSTENSYNPKQEEPEDFDSILDLYKLYVPEYFEKETGKDGEEIKNEFEINLLRRKEHIIYEIDLDNTKEILDWLKERGILRKFDKRALIDISVYGDINMLEKAYDGLKLNNSYLSDKVYTGKYSVYWTNYSEDAKRFQKIKTGYISSRKNGGRKTVENNQQRITGQELIKNIKLVEQLVKDGIIEPTIKRDDETIIFTPNWRLEKNLKLAETFGLGTKDEVYLPVTYLYGKDMEKVINGVIELGLLHPPMDDESKEIDKLIPRNDSFHNNLIKNGKKDQSIRDYFSRSMSKFKEISDEDIRFLSYLVATKGYGEFYQDFFSAKEKGKAGGYDVETIQNMHDHTEESRIDSVLYTLYDYPELIDNYDDIDQVVSDHEVKLKSSMEDYIDINILENELIMELEDNYRVEDKIELHGEIITKPNSYVYNFDGRLISRKKVLHIASILYNEYKYLNRDMIVYAVMKDSYFSEDDFYNVIDSIQRKDKEKAI